MREIIWHSEAEAEYFDILNYWIKHNHSTDYSLKIISEIKNTEEMLKFNPLIGTKIKSNNNIRRVLILRNFSLYYDLDEEFINVISFQDNRDNPEKLKN